MAGALAAGTLLELSRTGALTTTGFIFDVQNISILF